MGGTAARAELTASEAGRCCDEQAFRALGCLRVYKGAIWGRQIGNLGSKLSRYDVTFERSFYRALHELERVQARRNGRQVPPPAVVHIDVAVTPPPNQPS